MANTPRERAEPTVTGSKVCTTCGARYPADALFCPNDGTPLRSSGGGDEKDKEEDPYLGQEISGHIEIRQLIGIGAMGRVYRAFQKGIDRDVAVKILHRELSANSQLVSRFTREAKVASRLQHPNVVQVLLAGQLPDRALYMVMEYLDGMSLQSALAAAGGALPLARALHITLQLCEAAGEAHQQGIVHRDLKPENVMLVRRGADTDYVKVLDFGIARINWGEQSVATAAGLIFGTARYISPEGAQGNTVGPGSDVYGIATLVYQMLAGRTPFEGDQAVGLLVAQIHDPPPHIKEIPRARYVPDALADVIMANLAKDPKHREPDARAFGHAILDAAKQSGLSTDDISRPLHRRVPSAMHLPPMERTKQHDLTPDIVARMSPEPAAVAMKSNGHFASGATTKWEPPAEFQARLADAVGQERSERPSGVVPAAPPAAPSRPRGGVDETMDDALVTPPVPSSPIAVGTPPPVRVDSAPSFPTSDHPSVPRTMPGDPQFSPPSSPVRVESQPRVPVRPASDPHISSRPPTGYEEPRKSRVVMFVALCFVIGVLLTAGVAWKMGRLGGDSDQDRYVTRATDAMFKNRFVEPPGENVRDITDEGLRRWPTERRLIDVRVRTANELVTKALAQRSGGDVAEALRLAKFAHELDPNDASAKRLVEQYESEMAAFSASSAPPLVSPPPLASPHTAPPTAIATQQYKVLLDASVGQPRVGQTVDFIARIAPTKGTFDQPLFTITGPGLGASANMPAMSLSPGVYKASYVFLQGGRFEVAFTTQADGKPLRASRTVPAGDAPKPPDPPPTLPTAPAPTTTASVKWM